MNQSPPSVAAVPPACTSQTPPLRQRVVVGVVTRKTSVLISRRRATGPLAGYWEFPGGKVEAGESPPDALRREFREELGIDVEPIAPLCPIDHDYPHGPIRLLPMLCRHLAGRPRALAVATWRWVAVSELARYPFPPANAPLLDEVRCRLAVDGPLENLHCL